MCYNLFNYCDVVVTTDVVALLVEFFSMTMIRILALANQVCQVKGVNSMKPNK